MMKVVSVFNDVVLETAKLVEMLRSGKYGKTRNSHRRKAKRRQIHDI